MRRLDRHDRRELRTRSEKVSCCKGPVAALYRLVAALYISRAARSGPVLDVDDPMKKYTPGTQTRSGPVIRFDGPDVAQCKDRQLASGTVRSGAIF